MRLLLATLLCTAPLLATESDYASLLRAVVRTDGVDYAQFAKDDGALRKKLDAHVKWLEKAKPGKTDADKIAFWINAYNALTLHRVLETHTGKSDYSVHKVKGFWDDRKWTVAGRKLSLNEVEHGVLRREFSEPRIHFAVNCASRSCPPLIEEPYAGKTLDVVLTRQTRAYLADAQQNSFDEARERASISRIFKWYSEDFRADKAGSYPPLQNFLARYAPRNRLRASLTGSSWRISYREYDWSLNQSGVKPAKEKRKSGGWILLVVYFLATGALLLYGLHAYKMLRWRKNKSESYTQSLAAARATSALGRTEFPRLLVQVPIFNESDVARRAIDAAAALDYPDLEIQVLDDSTDETIAIVDAAVAEHAQNGVAIQTLRRSHRTGFKAGALAAGVAQSDAEFIAIFDADFVPAPNTLRLLLPLFDVDASVACVQARWEHLNRNQNWLTRAQAVGVDAHFWVEQVARAAHGAFLNFNGTAGIWRRAAIEDAGGWEGDTLTEDLDLSYRAQLRGWRIVVDPNVSVPAELPPTVAAFKSQQRRWACGNMQCARKHLGAVWRSSRPLGHKTEATTHLCSYGICVAMTVLVMLLPWGISHLSLVIDTAALWPLWIALWVAAGGPLMMSITGQRIRGSVSWLEIAACFFLGLGACANSAVAAVRGLVRPIRTFVRTPKQGGRHAPSRTRSPRLEQWMLGGTLLAVWLLARTEPAAVAMYALFCSGGFCFVVGYWWLGERRATQHFETGEGTAA